mgnify:CR=1 FL=1
MKNNLKNNIKNNNLYNHSLLKWISIDTFFENFIFIKKITIWDIYDKRSYKGK